MNPTESDIAVHLVDDDPSFLTAMARMLGASGYAVRRDSSTTEFLDALTPGSRGCVIADLSMPGLSGLDLQDALCASGNSMPVIFLTGHGDIASSVLAMRHGAEDF